MAAVKATGARQGRSAGKLMGHIRLGALPKSQKWNHVVGLIAGAADVEQIATASADAAENGLDRASDHIGLAHASWLLTQIPLIARQADFPSRLQALGLDGLPAEPTLIEIVAAFGRAVDRYVRATGRRTDLGEMAQHAASNTLASLAGRELPSLFRPTLADVQQGLAKLGTSGRFSLVARDFFSRLNELIARVLLEQRAFDARRARKAICVDRRAQ